jgi:hypothetical protein
LRVPSEDDSIRRVKPSLRWKEEKKKGLRQISFFGRSRRPGRP